MSNNLLNNGDFEDGVYGSVVGTYTNYAVPVGWTPDVFFVQDSSENRVFSANPYSGSFALDLGNNDPSQSYINAAVS